jgi:hypothetical protein
MSYLYSAKLDQNRLLFIEPIKEANSFASTINDASALIRPFPEFATEAKVGPDDRDLFYPKSGNYVL